MPFLHGYVWQRESFSLYLSTEQPPHWRKQSRSSEGNALPSAAPSVRT